MTDQLRFEGIEPEIEIRSESAREIAILFMKWNELGRTAEGMEMFERGAFRETKAEDIILRMEHEGPPVGRGIALEEREDGAVLVAKVANTARGDEALTLAKDGYYHGASPSFIPREGGTRYQNIERQRVAVRTLVDAKEVSLTWRPTFTGTSVLYARSQEEVNTVGQQDEMPVPVEQPQARGIERPTDANEYSELHARVQQLEQRKQEEPVPVPTAKSAPNRGEWIRGALTLMDGGSLSQHEQRALADIISADNPAFVPTVYSDQLIGIIDPARPFINSVSKLNMPDSGLEISFPRIVTRPTVGEQLTEKAEVTSTAVETDRITRSVRTFAGAGDLSLQLLRRSSPQFLDFYMALLAEAYAQTTEDAAVDALLASGVTAGTAQWDAADPFYGEAFENSIAAGRTLIPDRIWLSTTALVQMIDARSPTGGGGTPLYPSLAGIVGVNSAATGGPIPMQLTPIWTPALDNEVVDVIIGPSRGFATGEEGTFTLQADVPGRLGRDVALGGFMVFADLYPAAFTTYVVAT